MRSILSLALLICLAGEGLAAQTPIGSITITGSEQSSGGVWDGGTVTAIINGTHSVSYMYNQFSTPAGIASALGALISNSCNMPVYAQASGATLNFYAKGSNVLSTASITSVSSNPSLFSNNSFLGNGTAGGTSACAAVSNGGIIPAQGQTLCINAAGSANVNLPVMPSIELVQFDDNSCDVFNYTLTVGFAEQGPQYLLPGEETTAGYYESGDMPGNTPWIVDWTENEMNGIQGNGLPNYYEGGGAYALAWANGDDLVSNVSFWIAGVNPTLGTSGQVAQAAQSYGAPWWYGHELTEESSVTKSTTQQFLGGANSAETQVYGYYGAPVYGYPDGFGIAQVDGKYNSLSDSDLWSWEQNLYDGIQILNGFQTPAQNYWNTQWAQWQAWAAHASPQAASQNYPQPLSCGSGNFTATGTGNNQYYNLYWITAYNQGTVGDNNAWGSVDPTTGVWVYNSSYATSVCSTPSFTLPN